ncbi:MAG: hypothetical protein P8K08_09745 [Fuerstiella sp.]|jgi:hypothetical protein|nr:hypothetical protein [Fuerstiella sp.]
MPQFFAAAEAMPETARMPPLQLAEGIGAKCGDNDLLTVDVGS